MILKHISNYKKAYFSYSILFTSIFFSKWPLYCQLTWRGPTVTLVLHAQFWTLCPRKAPWLHFLLMPVAQNGQTDTLVPMASPWYDPRGCLGVKKQLSIYLVSLLFCQSGSQLSGGRPPPPHTHTLALLVPKSTECYRDVNLILCPLALMGSHKRLRRPPPQRNRTRNTCMESIAAGGKTAWRAVNSANTTFAACSNVHRRPRASTG